MAEPNDTAAPASSYAEPHAYGQDERRTSREEENVRAQGQWRDWLILAVMMLVSLGYHFLIFYFQPGLG
ncbi:hypothetical protein HKCCE3408_11205 [Rhodobacterales bacterium HKCCE3408]|nr:hypothetical protein [Rhodobacterales bacterium HKCCE3408]